MLPEVEILAQSEKYGHIREKVRVDIDEIIDRDAEKLFDLLQYRVLGREYGLQDITYEIVKCIENENYLIIDVNGVLTDELLFEIKDDLSSDKSLTDIEIKDQISEKGFIEKKIKVDFQKFIEKEREELLDYITEKVIGREYGLTEITYDVLEVISNEVSTELIIKVKAELSDDLLKSMNLVI